MADSVRSMECLYCAETLFGSIGGDLMGYMGYLHRGDYCLGACVHAAYPVGVNVGCLHGGCALFGVIGGIYISECPAGAYGKSTLCETIWGGIHCGWKCVLM